jgi:hypothetical protein
VGLEFAIVKDILSVSVGFSIEEKWTHTATFKCNVSPRSVGQIWTKNRIAVGDVSSKRCKRCPRVSGCGGGFGANPHPVGFVTAPAMWYWARSGAIRLFNRKGECRVLRLEVHVVVADRILAKQLPKISFEFLVDAGSVSGSDYIHRHSPAFIMRDTTQKIRESNSI